MDNLSAFFNVFDAYVSATQMAEGTVSRLVLNGGSRASDLRAGRSDIGIRRLERGLQWFSDNWPDSAIWPEMVRRPARSGVTA